MRKKFMKRNLLFTIILKFCFIGLFMVIFYGILPDVLFAQTCYPQRVINQHRCQSTIYTGCMEYTVPNTAFNCSGTGSSPAIANADCRSNCVPDEASCNQSQAYCSQYLPFLNQCVVSSFLASCTEAPSCNVTANIISCTQSGNTCTENTSNLTYECWANGPVSTPPAESGGCASGQCFNGIASCAEVGQTNTGASCTGGLCCAPNSSYVPGCPYDAFQTDFPGYAPGADCRYSEAGACHWRCTTWGSGCDGCADGLVGSSCLCPSCNINFSPKNVTIAVGEKRDITIQNIPTDWRRHDVSYPLPQIVGDFDERYDLEYRFRHFENGSTTRTNPPTVVDAKLRNNGNQIRLEGLAPGTSRIEVRARYTGYSPRALCSRFITVAVNAVDVPCGDVTNFSLGPQNACDDSTVAGGQGNLQARWTEVTDADQYELILTGATVGQLAPIYVSSAVAGCNTAAEDEVCQFSITGLVRDTYTGSIRAASSTNVCQQQTTYATSAPFDVTYCPGTVTAIGKSVASAGLSCAAIIASANSPNVNFTLSGSSTYNQNNVNPATFNAIQPGTWAISSTAPSGSTSVGPVCWVRGAANGSGNSASVGSYQNLTFYLPFAAGNPWQQVSGGDSITCSTVNSPVGVNANPRQFMKKPASGAPGIVSYGNNYDFDPDAGNGANLVSESNWLVQESPASLCSQNWYEYFFNKFGLLGVSPDKTGGSYNQSEFPSRTQPYIVSGDLSTQGAWSIPQGNSVVIFVTGNLTINGNITLVGKSFLGFVVSGNITVNPAVTNMDGVFINNGTFDSGSGATQLTVNGTVVAGNIDLGRDMGANNDTTPGEVFNYSPKLLFSMPADFMGMNINWQEVAP